MVGELLLLVKEIILLEISKETYSFLVWGVI